MSWFVDFSLLAGAFASGLGIVVHVNRRRFERRVAREARALVAIQPSDAPRAVSNQLPAVVARYRQLAVGDHAPVRTLRIRHGGNFQLSPTAKPKPIRGEQLFTADPPGFVWTGRVRMAPGLWIDARDMIVAGTGSMRVLIDDTVRVADAHGPQIDQGSALRLLAEMVWFPTALFDPRTVTWSEIDACHARATLRSGKHAVSGVFEFGSDGLPLGMTAERFDDKGELRPWGGTYRDWRTVEGMRVPFEAEVAWQLEPPYVYAHWLVDSLEYETDSKRGAAVVDAKRAVAQPIGRWAVLAIALELVLGIGALGGGIALMAGPNGEILPLPVSALAGSPFASYFVPGAILFTILGVGPIVAAVLAYRRHPLAPLLALAVGGALVIWIVVEIAIVGYSNHPPLQILYLGLGGAITFVGVAWVRAPNRSGALHARSVGMKSEARTARAVG